MNLIIILSLFILLVFYIIKQESELSIMKIISFIFIGMGLQYIALISHKVINFFISTEKSYQLIAHQFDDIPLIVLVISVVVMGPIIEEFIFRKLIQTWLHSKFNPTITIIIQALIFGLSHSNFYMFIHTFVLGIIFGLFYYKYKSISIPIILHISLNLSAVIFNEILLYKIPTVFFAILLFIGLYSLKIQSGKRPIKIN
ncbi:MAG: CPBP family intramembrane glutamic endopeptidase [Bacillota bacterium]|nr:CPBP family intramembrane glutamic endopeptidase [Bacillota bacterium]